MPNKFTNNVIALPINHVKQDIADSLWKLNKIDGVTVTISDTDREIRIEHRGFHAAGFYFKWLADHYAGYHFLPGNKQTTQAVISIWTRTEAFLFTTAFSILIELKAKR